MNRIPKFGKGLFNSHFKKCSLPTFSVCSNALKWNHMETQSMQVRANPLPLSALNIMNLRALLEKCSQQGQINGDISMIMLNNQAISSAFVPNLSRNSDIVGLSQIISTVDPNRSHQRRTG